MFRLGVVATALLTVLGCSQERLILNTIDVGSNIDRIYKNQALINLSKTIDDFWHVPSQAELSIGTIQTSNSITPSVNFPLSHTLLENGVGLLQARTRPSTGASIAGNDAWQQTWQMI